MKHYYIKTLFSGWNEVGKNSYERYIKHLRDGITTMSGEKKEEYIKTKILVVNE